MPPGRAAAPHEGGADDQETTGQAGRAQATCGCDCEYAPHGPMTPHAWLQRHGIDLLGPADRRRLNEITALKSGRRICDLPAAVA